MSSLGLGSLLCRVIDPRTVFFMEHWEIFICQGKVREFQKPLAVVTITNELKET